MVKFLESRLDRVVRDLSEQVKQSVEKEMRERFSDMGEFNKLGQRLRNLREEIVKLEVERDKKQEDFARREREIEHKVGLEKKRQEQELALAKREAQVAGQEAALTADRKRFEEQMEFHQERFEKEITYQRELLQKMLERLPSAEIIARFGNTADEKAA